MIGRGLTAPPFPPFSHKEYDNGSSDQSLQRLPNGSAATALVGFYGATPIAQRAGAAQATSLVGTASSTALDTATKAALIEVMNTLARSGCGRAPPKREGRSGLSDLYQAIPATARLGRSRVPAMDAAGIEHSMVWEVGCPYVSHARATMLRKALDWGAEAIVFLDHDLSFEPGPVEIDRGRGAGGLRPLSFQEGRESNTWASSARKRTERRSFVRTGASGRQGSGGVPQDHAGSR
jgi:hypothetical protein